jgi:Icc-related predicted phosphoesterase
MRVLFFSDIHSDLKSLERLIDQEADYYFCAGDLVSWARGLDKAGEILARRAGKVFVIPGNHESEADIARLCTNYGLRNLHGQCVTLGSVHIAALGYSNPTPFHTPGEYTEAELTARLAPFAKLDPLVLACHCPPFNTPLDRGHGNRHFGSTAIASFIDQVSPRYFLCGHIHEAEGVQSALGIEGKTIGINVGKRGYLLDLEALLTR